jgi:hypothetical protein
MEHMNCQACNSLVPVRLKQSSASRGTALGCCAQCQSFTCGFHGVRDRISQQFRCVECFPSLLLINAAIQSGSENESAKAIMYRQPAAASWLRLSRIEPELFLRDHDLVSEQTRQLLSDFFHDASFNICQAETGVPGWDKTIRDLQRIQLSLEGGSQSHVLKLAAAYTAFVYPVSRDLACSLLPREMQILRNAIQSQTVFACN